MRLLTGKNRWLLHITYWVMVVLLFTFFWGTRYGNYWVCFYNELYFLPIKIAATYFGLYYLIPQLFKRNYYRVVVAGSFMLIGSGLLQRIIGYYSFIPEVGFYLPDIPLFDITEILHKIMDINAVMIIPFSIKFYTHYLDKEHKILILSQEKTEAELQFLRSQIQPHFLFNVLNDIYAMALLNKKETPDSILKLADLMRYVLQESTASKVPLEKEINYIRNYIDLEKLRYNDLYAISFEIHGDSANKMITPLLLLPFIENAYKHSTTNDTGGAWIKIRISLTNEVLTLEIMNSFDRNIPKVTQVSSGIGIQNVKKRLDILYQGKYTFYTENTPESYKTILTINLDT
ncbi:MAG: histidine kinase [Paludibacteraceae bacterium]|nr:histidine kinase [Paludibacteraceae bacterium]MBP8628348.1 histidine kinase [Paludibacteraceae bacterium]MBP8781284.1 histidine kinase [Paludibacteraceae bacterium]MBP9648648.1 histidine kinase [Paludibacteraceae bacterium]MBP9970402.1 histidine kinase [Paludibacteraceae bacterium]